MIDPITAGCASVAQPLYQLVIHLRPKTWVEKGNKAAFKANKLVNKFNRYLKNNEEFERLMVDLEA